MRWHTYKVLFTGQSPHITSFITLTNTQSIAVLLKPYSSFIESDIHNLCHPVRFQFPPTSIPSSAFKRHLLITSLTHSLHLLHSPHLFLPSTVANFHFSFSCSFNTFSLVSLISPPLHRQLIPASSKFRKSSGQCLNLLLPSSLPLIISLHY